MFLGSAAIGRGHRVEKQSARCKIDRGRAGNPHGIYVTALEIGSWYWRAKVALPNHGAGSGTQRINIIRLGHRNDHRTICTSFDIKRLGVNVPRNRAIEVQVTRQAGTGRRRKGGIDIKTVAGRIVVFLRNVDLRGCRRNETAQREHENCDNENETRHTPAKRPLRPAFYNRRPTVCQGFMAAQSWRKGYAMVNLPGKAKPIEQLCLRPRPSCCVFTALCYIHASVFLSRPWLIIVCCWLAQLRSVARSRSEPNLGQQPSPPRDRPRRRSNLRRRRWKGRRRERLPALPRNRPSASTRCTSMGLTSR